MSHYRPKDGKDGLPGTHGKDGRDGVDGQTPEHDWVGTNLRFKAPNGEFGEFVDLEGPRGEKGDQGDTGDQGPKGDKGDPGPRGLNGDKGDKGERGSEGEKGDIGPMPDHQWRDTSLRFQDPDGTWGRYVNLKGEKGDPGIPGASGGGMSRITASKVEVATLLGSTYNNVQEVINVMLSPGIITGGEVTELSPTVVRITAGTAVVRVADDNVSELRFFDFVSQDFSVPDVQVTHFYALDYNGGSPVMVESTVTENWDRDTEIPLGSAVRGDGFLNVTPNPYRTGDVITNLIQRLDAVSPVQRDNSVGGLVLGQTGVRNVTVTAGRLWSRVSDFSIASKNSATEPMASLFFNGTNLTVTSGITQWDNQNYNSLGTGTLVPIGNNKWANLWFFMSFDGSHYGFAYGTADYNSLGQAANEGIPSYLTQNFFNQFVLLGRFVFQESSVTPAQIESAFDSLFSTQAINNHNDLGGLQGGAVGEFYHLTSAQNTAVSGAVSAGGFVNISGTQTITGSKQFNSAQGFMTPADVSEALIFVNANSLSNPTPAIEVYTDNGTTQANISATSYGANGGGIFHGRGARGTRSSPTAVQAGDIYAGYGGRPYASGIGFTSSSPVSLHWVASENQSSTNLGGYFRVLTTPKGSASRQERLLVCDSGTSFSHDTGTYDPASASQVNFLSGWTGFLSSATGQMSRVVAVTYGGGGTAALNLATTNGTAAAPTALTSTQLLGTVSYTTYNGSVWAAPGAMFCEATENHSPTAMGTSFRFEVTPNGTIVRIVGLKIEHDGRVWGSALHNNTGAVTGTTQQYIASGTYTPTLTNTTNVAASTSNVSQWMRVGNVVTVSGLVAIDPTAAGLVILGISLPIASDFNADSQLGGMAGSLTESAQIFADQTNNRALLAYTAVAVNNLSFPFTFTYLVL